MCSRWKSSRQYSAETAVRRARHDGPVTERSEQPVRFNGGPGPLCCPTFIFISSPKSTWHTVEVETTVPPTTATTTGSPATIGREELFCLEFYTSRIHSRRYCCCTSLTGHSRLAGDLLAVALPAHQPPDNHPGPVALIGVGTYAVWVYAVAYMIPAKHTHRPISAHHLLLTLIDQHFSYYEPTLGTL